MIISVYDRMFSTPPKQIFQILSDINFVICKCFNPFPNKPLFLDVCSTSLLQTMWEKEKSLMTSNFSFSHNVFQPFRALSTIYITSKIVVCNFLKFGRVYISLFGKRLSPNSIDTHFDTSTTDSF